MTVFIYCLVDPITTEIRYVGKTIDINVRMRLHITAKLKTHKACWIKSLLAKGMRPELEVLEVIPKSNDEDWQDAERWWIQYLRFIGCRLTNSDSGGIAGKRHSQEVRDKCGLANIGRVLTKEHREKVGAFFRGRPLSDEHKKKLSERRKGLVLSVEWRENIRLSHLGYRPTPEHRANLSRAHKGAVFTPERCANISAAKMGHPVSAETRAKIGAARKAAYLRELHATPS